MTKEVQNKSAHSGG